MKTEPACGDRKVLASAHALIERAVADRIDEKWLKEARAFLNAPE
jgi:hypothetical protein